MRAHTAHVAALTAATGLTAVAAYHVALAAGAPWGAAAWGGQHTRLPPGLRAGSAASALVLTAAAALVLARVGAPRPGRRADRTLGAATWGLGLLLLLSGVANLASSSSWERRMQGPLALILAALCFVVARSGSVPRTRSPASSRPRPPRSR